MTSQADFGRCWKMTERPHDCCCRLNDVDIGQSWIHRLNYKADLGDGITPASPIAPAPVRLCDPGGVEKPLLAERYASILLRRPANLGENYFAYHPIFVHGSTS